MANTRRSRLVGFGITVVLICLLGQMAGVSPAGAVGPPAAFGKVSPPNGAANQPISLTLLWGAAVGAASYEYCVDASDDDACAGWVDVGAATGAAVSGLSPDTVYFWQVRASNAFGTTYADGGAFWDFATLVPGTLAAWGYDNYGQVSGTPAGTGFVAVAAGRYHSLALRADGSIASWGSNDSGEVSGTPAGTGFVAVAAGANHSLALRAHGSIAAWGRDDYGQVSETPAGTGFVAVAAGFFHSLALRADGSIAAWGDDGFGEVSGTPAGDGFVAVAAGEHHSLALVTLLEATFLSLGGYDGWVLERDEDSGKGGPLDTTATTARIGDNNTDRQYRSILDFDTSGLPDNAVVTGVTVRIKKQALVGTNPFDTHGLLLVDMKTGFYHDIQALEKYDFQAAGSRGNVGRFIKTPSEGWYRAPLRARNYSLINLTGTTQFRLRFEVDDNDNSAANYLSFYTGGAALADRPELIVSYYIP